mgnify:CR=1 FL=1
MKKAELKNLLATKRASHEFKFMGGVFGIRFDDPEKPNHGTGHSPRLFDA